MGLHLPDRWIWDFWFATRGDEVHVFYLQAPRSLGDPDLRHRNATVGHAVSTDLSRWRVLPSALGPGPAGAFDDLAIWTGSTIAHDNAWWMFYTGIDHASAGLVQRVGLARSDDLVSWTRVPGWIPLRADGRWYEQADGHPAGEETWRDPWVFPDAAGRFHMLITARARSGPVDGRGVIGHLSSPDLFSWDARPPLSEPGEFTAMEVPQQVSVGTEHLILFSATEPEHSAARLGRPGVRAESGTHYVRASGPLGRYRLDRDAFLVAGPRFYAGRMLARNGCWWFFAWEADGLDGRFVGGLSDPMAVTMSPDGPMVRMPAVLG